MEQRHDLDFLNVARILQLPAATGNGHPVIYEQLNAAIEGVSWKDAVRVSTQGNLNLSSPGSSIDGITMDTGDRFLARSQTTQSQNGIYIWNGAAVAATRAPDASTSIELEGAVVSVEEGTDAGATFRQTQVNFTLDSGNVIWTSFGSSAPAASESTAGIAELATQAETDTGTDDARIVTPLKLNTWSGRARRHVANFGDGSTLQFDFSHNFNTRDVDVQVYRNGTPWDNIGCNISRPDANTVRLNFATGLAPTTDQFRVMIKY